NSWTRNGLSRPSNWGGTVEVQGRVDLGEDNSKPLKRSTLAAQGLAQRLHAYELDEFRRGLPQMVAVEKRFEGIGRFGGQRGDLGIGARFVEKWDGLSLLAVADHTMLSRFDSAAAPALQHVTEIHRQQVFRRRHI